ncbi:MAG: apolipoprotein N-acyltransferase [Actinomycetaceae bacterium]|nr:apolipoprotein N-acyltransferase [Actinomycetaceae bacterium]
MPDNPGMPQDLDHPQDSDLPQGPDPKPDGTPARPGALARRLRPLLPLAGAVAAGLCLYASFAPLGLWYMAPVGIALLVAVLRERGAWQAFGLGLVAGYAFFASLVDWASEAAGTPLARLGIGVVMALYIGALAVCWCRLIAAFGHRPWILAPALALTWVAMEQLRGSWPAGGMPWGTLAFGQVEGPLLHLAPYGATQAVGLAVVAAGTFLEALARSLAPLRASATRTLALPRTPRGRPDYARALSLCAASVFLLASPALLPLPSQPRESTTRETITVAFVQGHVPSKEELSSGQDRALTVTGNLAEQTREVEGRGADLVLWPESASDYDATTDPAARRIVEGTSSRLGVPLLLGTQRYPEDYRYNDYVVWMPGQGPASRYTKQHPIPFGEWMPWRGFFRLFTSAVDQITINMRAGHEPALLTVNAGERRVRIATPICFEIAYTSIVSEAVRGGAQLIVVPTNNASFGHSAESYQQFDMTRFQAVASGKTAVQVSTVGVSGIADPDGQIRELTEPWEATSRVAQVHLSDTVTIASRFEGYISLAVYLCGSALAGLALLRGASRASIVSRWRDTRARKAVDEGSRHHPDLQRNRVSRTDRLAREDRDARSRHSGRGR